MPGADGEAVIPSTLMGEGDGQGGWVFPRSAGEMSEVQRGAP